MPTDEGSALKADLRLRSEYPFLTTRIFALNDRQHAIVFDRALLDAAAISPHFDHSIRPVTAMVSLSNQIPEQYHREIAPLADTEISRNFVALPLTKSDLDTLLAAKFPEFDLCAANTIRGGLVELVVKTEPSPELRAAVQEFMDNFKTHETTIRFDPAAQAAPPEAHHSSWHIQAAKLRPTAPRFVKDDETFWFENIDRIYDGSFTFQPLPGAEDLGTACFIDFTFGNEQLNIRQALLYYDTVIVAPPLRETEQSWERQQLSQDDYLRLIDAGRLKFALLQPEERGNVRLLEAAYEHAPSSIIGRRASAAIVLADLVRTTQEYKLGRPELITQVDSMSRALAGELGWKHEDLTRFFLWPNSALRQSLHPLLTNGALGVSAFGQDEILAENFKSRTGRDLRLEMMGPGYQTHLAHALNATVIPALDQPANWIWIYRTIGDRLNFYRSFNTRIAAAWAANERRKEEKRIVVPPLPVFEFDADTRIDEFIEATSLGSTRRKGRALLTRLADLPVEERQGEVAKLATQARRFRGREAGLFSLESLEDAGPLTDLVVGTAAPPYFAMRNLIRRIVSYRDRSASFDRIMDAIERELNPLTRKNEDLDFLSKIDRVAQLRRSRIS